MIETIIESIEQVNELPAVKKVYNNQFVKSRVDQFEKFLGKIVKKNVEKAIEPSRRKLTILNWFLINLVVLAYFSGLAEAKKIDDFQVVFDNFNIIGLTFLVTNITALIFMKLGFITGKVIEFILQVFVILLVLFFIYWAILKLINWFSKPNVEPTTS
jgi:hypothetical protein